MNAVVMTVVTISRNNLQGLRRTLDSVREQDYPHIEHIVIDGNSQDGSKELLQSYAHSKAYRYCSEPDNGISSAFNKGLQKGTGNLIFFLNSGDQFHGPTIVSEVVTSYLTHHWKCAQGGVMTANYEQEEVLYMPPNLPSWCLKYLMFLPHQGFFCEMALHQQFCFDENIKTSMDYDIFLQMLDGTKIHYLQQVIARVEAGGVSSQSRRRIREQSLIRLKYARSWHERVLIALVNAITVLKDSLKINSPFASKPTKELAQ